MREKILTIVIPTFNRSSKLKVCLDNVCPQICSDISVVVLDNHSTNYNFSEFIKPYVDKYGVNAIRNSANIGLEGNILRSFEICETKWLWILGDDDYLMTGAVQKVLSIVEQNPDVQFIKLNSTAHKITSGIYEFSQNMRGLYDFSNSYFLSEGIHNVSRIGNYLSEMYKKSSTCIPQILYVIDMCIKEPTTQCFFSTELVLREHGQEITWNHSSQIWCFLTLFDIYYNWRSVFKDNIFRNNSYVCWMYVRESQLPLNNKLYYYRQIVVKYGIYNFIRYNLKRIIRVYLSIIVPTPIKRSIKKIIKG